MDNTILQNLTMMKIQHRFCTVVWQTDYSHIFYTGYKMDHKRHQKSSIIFAHMLFVIFALFYKKHF